MERIQIQDANDLIIKRVEGFKKRGYIVSFYGDTAAINLNSQPKGSWIESLYNGSGYLIIPIL